MKLNLSDMFIHTGQKYGPGNVDVPDAVGEDLKKAMQRVAQRKQRESREREGILKPEPKHETSEESQK